MKMTMAGNKESATTGRIPNRKESRRLLALLVLLVLSCFTTLAVAASKTTDGPEDSSAAAEEAKQPLSNVLHMVFDSNKDGKVTMKEVKEQLGAFEDIFASSADSDTETLGYVALLKAAQQYSPKLFELVDVNGDQLLSSKELKFVTDFEKSMRPKTPKERNLETFMRSCFELIDSNGDDEVSPEELMSAKTMTATISKIAKLFHGLFPKLRPTAKDLEPFLVGAIESFGASAAYHISGLDANDDGAIQRTEVGRAYNQFGKNFLEMAETIKSMGPLFAMMNSGMGNDFIRTDL